MRAPFQEGDFPGPVKYGYLNVGTVEQGPADLRGRTVFCLYPHQTAYVVPAGAVTVVPDDVPPARAVLGGHRRDRRQRPVGRRTTARRSGHRCRRRDGRVLRGAPAEPVPGGARHAGGHRPRPGRCRGSTRRRLRAARRRRGRPRPRRARQRDVRRATAVARPARAGGHRDRPQLVRRPARSACRWAGRFTPVASRIRSSQVGTVSPARSGRRTTADRVALALDLLRDPAFDALVTGESRFCELPDVMARLAAGSLPALCHTITYEEVDSCTA